jgi:hypothetical protein
MVDKKLLLVMNRAVGLFKQLGENNPCLGPAPQFPWLDCVPLRIMRCKVLKKTSICSFLPPETIKETGYSLVDKHQTPSAATRKPSPSHDE